MPGRSNLITPAIPERTLPTARSTVRRLGGLSKFGGPARRVILPQGSEDAQVQESVENGNVNELQGRHSSALISELIKNSHLFLLTDVTEIPDLKDPRTFIAPRTKQSLPQLQQPDAKVDRCIQTTDQ